MSINDKPAVMAVGFALAACVNSPVLAQEATLPPEQPDLEAPMAGFEQSQLERSLPPMFRSSISCSVPKTS